MKTSKISIKNYKCIGNEPLVFDFCENILVLIGENNVGKSSVLDAVEFFFSGGKTIKPDMFHNRLTDENNAIEIEIEFDSLSSEDKVHQAVTPYLYLDNEIEKWVIKKKYFYKDEKSCAEYYAKQGDIWKKNPSGWNSNVDDLFTNEKMQVIKVDAVKKVEDETAPKGSAAFAQIFNLVIEKEVEKTNEYKNLVESIDNYSKLFKEGTKLEGIKDLESEISTKIKRVANKTISKIDSTPPQNIGNSIMPIPKLLTNDLRDIDVLPENQGNGLQRALIFCLLELLAEKKSPSNKGIGPKNLILIEEPEIYMHPQMERKIADTLYSLAKTGTVQVICTTHSPVFINMADSHAALCRIVRGKIGDSVLCQNTEEIFTSSTKEDQKKRLRMILNFDPSVNEVFFAQRVVLVEGDTEVAVLSEAADLLEIFKGENYHFKRDTTIVNCRGKWTITAFQEVLNKLKIPYVVIHDQDEDKENTGASGKILELLNNDESKRKMFVDKIETQLGIADIGKDKPFRAINEIQKLAKEKTLESKLGEYVNFAYGISS